MELTVTRDHLKLMSSVSSEAVLEEETSYVRTSP